MSAFRRRLWFYRISAFISGMSVMAVELAASRLLAPYFSSSLPVWSVIIGLIMAAMAFGNYRGGKLADRAVAKGSDAALYRRMLIAALWIAVIPLVGKYLIVAVAAIAAVVAGSQVIVIGSILACLLLFVAPMVLLGMVSPFLVRVASARADDKGSGTLSFDDKVPDPLSSGNTGAVIGSIYAWGTLGSILGTFLASFVTIPDVGVARTYLLFAVALAALVLIHALATQGRWWPAAVALVCCVALLAAPLGANYAFWEKGILYQGESSYNYLQVSQDDTARYFSTNVLFGVQSLLPRQYLEGRTIDQPTGEYYDGMIGACGLLANFTPGHPIDALMLGLGTGTCPALLQQALPGSTCTGVELDSKIVDVAHKYFALTPADCQVVVGDGRSYIQQHTQKYDLIMVDAYQDVSVPFYMASHEFYTLAASRLKPGGVLVCNVNMGTRNNSAVVNALAATMSSVFGPVYAYNPPGTSNTLLYAAPGGSLVRLNSSLQACSAVEADQAQADGRVCPGSLVASTALMRQCIQGVADGAAPIHSSARVLTDDRAPTELLANKALNNMIAEQRAGIQQQVDAEGGGARGWWRYLQTLLAQ
ncbi:MAG: fused MFS/spermidine synthase [Coriobacteriia bacterium]|nr:fused MFS/spermidine synthase [Coriobacteriia bacterium]